MTGQSSESDRCGAAFHGAPTCTCPDVVARRGERARIALIELNRQEPPAQHALYQHDDPDADYYDGPGCVTCETRGPKWCDEHGPLLISAEPINPPAVTDGQGED